MPIDKQGLNPAVQYCRGVQGVSGVPQLVPRETLRYHTVMMFEGFQGSPVMPRDARHETLGQLYVCQLKMFQTSYSDQLWMFQSSYSVPNRTATVGQFIFSYINDNNNLYFIKLVYIVTRFVLRSYHKEVITCVYSYINIWS